MNIDDILRSIESPAAGPQRHFSRYAATTPTTTNDSAASRRDLQLLTRAYIAERSCPELLPWPGKRVQSEDAVYNPEDNDDEHDNGLVERTMKCLERQIEAIERMTGDMEPATNFALIVIQTELERWRWLVRGLVRVRMAKIDKHTLHYLTTTPMPTLRSTAGSTQPGSSHTPSSRGRMAAPITLLSRAEREYASRHQALRHNHFLSSFLGAFPPALQQLNDTAGAVAMVDVPDAELTVFVRVLRSGVIFAGRGVDDDDIYEGREGDVLVIRWADARGLVETGEAEVI